jgi:predicted nucleotidyltransferase
MSSLAIFGSVARGVAVDLVTQRALRPEMRSPVEREASHVK